MPNASAAATIIPATPWATHLRARRGYARRRNSARRCCASSGAVSKVRNPLRKRSSRDIVELLSKNLGKVFARAMQVRLHGPIAALHERRDLADGLVFVIEQNDSRSWRGAQRAQRALQIHAGARLDAAPRGLDLADPLRAARARRDADGDATYPGPGPLVLGNLPPVDEQPVERLLGRVLGGLTVPEDQLHRPEDGPVFGQEEHLERLVTLSHLFPLQRHS